MNLFVSVDEDTLIYNNVHTLILHLINNLNVWFLLKALDAYAEKQKNFYRCVFQISIVLNSSVVNLYQAQILHIWTHSHRGHEFSQKRNKEFQWHFATPKAVSVVLETVFGSRKLLLNVRDIQKWMLTSSGNDKCHHVDAKPRAWGYDVNLH